MRVISTVLLAIFLLAIESAVVRALGLEVTRIDVSVVLVVFLGVRSSLLEGAFGSFLTGYVLDVMSGRPTTLYIFLAMMIFLVTRLGASLIDSRARALFALMCAASSLLHGLLATFFTSLTAPSGSAPVATLAGLPLQVVLTGLVGALLWPLLRRLLDPNLDRQATGVLL